MANIRKTFNFRNGVQVDEDNLIVNPLGLVGIGTSVPTEILDVRGNAKIVGLVTATQIFSPSVTIGVSTITSLRAGANISLNSGIVTATTGVVTYYGDGGRLLNLPTSQWLDVDVGLGFTSIYAQGYVGISTFDPRFVLQIGGNNDLNNFINGVGINSVGDIVATGIVTAGSFVGFGSNITEINADNITSGTLTNSRLPVLNNDRLPTSINLSGIITASSGFIGNLTGNVIGIASTAIDVDSTSNITVNRLTSTTSLNATNLNVGIATASTRIYSGGTIGINTNTPQSDFHIFKTLDASLQLTGERESEIIIGRTLDKTQNAASLRYGETSGITNYSRENAVDFVNYDVGHVNSYIHLGNSAGIGTGNFNWIYGKNPNNPLLTLTYDGRLGVGLTNPSRTLEVNGIGTFTSSLFVGGTLNVAGGLNVGGVLQVVGTINGSFSGPLSGSVNLPSGNTETSSFYQVLVSAGVTANYMSVNAPPRPGTSNIVFQVNSGNGAFIISSSAVGIKTDKLQYIDLGLDCTTTQIGARAIAIGRTQFDANVDFSRAGKGETIGEYFEPGCFMIIPKVDSAGRDNIVQPKTGGLIYNTTDNKFQGYTNTGWINLH